MALIAGKAGREERSPDAEGGPGTVFIASRLATGWSDIGKFSLGASTILSVAESPRATLMV